MNHGDEKNGCDGESDPLDRILGGARWPEPHPASLSRLEKQWRAISAARLRRKYAIWMSAAAAVLVIGVSTWWLRPQPANDGKPTVAIDNEAQRANHSLAGQQKRLPSQNRTGDNNLPKTALPETVVESVSRPPTVYEVLAFHAIERKKALSTASQPNDKLLTETLDQMTGERSGEELAELSKPLMSSRSYFESRLLEMVRRATGDRLSATVQLLGQIGSETSVPTLIELSRRPETRVVAVQGLSRLGDFALLSQLAAVENDAELQQLLLAELLSRGDAQSVSSYLDFVASRSMHEAALAATDRVTNPPIEVLFQFMESHEYAKRFAAARALGRIDGPIVAKRLIALVAGSQRRQEAVVALLSSEGPEVQQFLAYARQHPLLNTLIRVGEIQLQLTLQ